LARVKDESRSKIMASIKRRDTKPELLLRKELWRRGLRGYRLDVQLPGRPDIFFPKHKLCIFVDGCFWHGCPIHYKGVARNTEYWDAKIQRNIARDQAITKSLIAMGFTVMRFWDHEINCDGALKVADELQAFIQYGLRP
jgi:DNA mismatch endonuclease (patch repair protein)